MLALNTGPNPYGFNVLVEMCGEILSEEEDRLVVVVVASIQH